MYATFISVKEYISEPIVFDRNVINTIVLLAHLYEEVQKMQNVEVINKSSIISLPELFYREDTHPTPSPTNSVSKLSEMYTMFVYPYTNVQFFFTVYLQCVSLRS